MIIFGFSQGFLGQHSALSLTGTGLAENNVPPSSSSSSHFSSSAIKENKEDKEGKEDKNENKDEKSKERVIYYVPLF